MTRLFHRCLIWSCPGVALLLLLGGDLNSAEPSAVAFTKEPTARKVDGQVRIDFAVNRETDVAVFIENEAGQVVRHLVAGMLGKNPPAPLRAGALEQSLRWDGTDDDGKPASGGPFRARVTLGMQVRYGGMTFTEQSGPNHLTLVHGLAVGPGGRLCVMDSRSGWLYWPAKGVHVFRRDGSYEKTILPFPSHLALERLKPLGAFRNDAGQLNPLIHRMLGATFYPHDAEPATQFTVTPAGQVILPVVPTQAREHPDNRGSTAHLAAIDMDGGIPFAHFTGPALGTLVHHGSQTGAGPYLQASTDGKSVYLVHLGQRLRDPKTAAYVLKVHPVVYKVPVPALGPARVFFGEVDRPGDDQAHLNEPHGLCLDGQGHLLVADSGNNRIVVLREKDAGFVASFPVESPQWVGADPKTGAVYVHSKTAINKFSGWKDAREVARLDLKPIATAYAGWGTAKLQLSFALDCSADPPVLWVGRGTTATDKPLLRCEDEGTRFSELKPAHCFATPRHWRPASDPTHRLVACRIDAVNGGGAALHILDEASGAVKKVGEPVKKVRLPANFGNNQGTASRLDREGNIYSCSAGGGIFKSDQNGKLIPFPATAADPKLKGHLPAGSTGTTAWERDWYVDRKGDIYVKVRGTAYHGLMHVGVFGPDGKEKRTAVWGVTDGAYGPRVDPAGNVYLMECIKPLGEPFPREFEPHVTDPTVKHWYDWIYGSVVKFSPQGGNFHLPPLAKVDHPLADPIPLPASFAKEKVQATMRKGESFVQGALWWRPGFAHLGDALVRTYTCHCHCTGCDFDVDDFGRAFVPDNGRFRVGVLDTNGNVILHFGAYGNQDCCGPDSYVLDPKEHYLRPRRPDNPPELVSPFAQPEIAFSWIIGLAVTDRHVYVADMYNRRVLRCRLDYTLEKTIILR